MSTPVSKDHLAPVIAIALDEAWGNRYGEDAVEELSVESKHIAQAVLKIFTVSLPEDTAKPEHPDLDGLPLNTILRVAWRTGGGFLVLRKTKHRHPGLTSGHWECVSDNVGEVWTDWEIELVADTVELIALGVTHE